MNIASIEKTNNPKLSSQRENQFKIKLQSKFGGAVRRFSFYSGIFIFFISFSLSAQINTPQVSPHATISQTIGLSTITVDYHRPGVKGREIWGALVP